MEKFESPTSKKDQLREKLEAVFEVKIGNETTLETVQKNFHTSKYRKATVIITPDFNVYLSNKTHYEVAKENGLELSSVVLTELDRNGKLGLTAEWMEQRRLATVFLTPEHENLWKEIGEDAFLEIITQACANKVQQFVREHIDPNVQ